MNQAALAQDPDTPPSKLWSLIGGSPSFLALPERVSGCSLRLLSVGPNKASVLRDLCDLMLLGLREVQALADSTPSLIAEDLDLPTALQHWRSLCSLGARIELIAPELSFNDELCPLVAQNPRAPAELLWYLALHPSAPTQQALIQNPAVPIELLCILAPAYPESFLQNPLLPLLQLEDPCLNQFPEEFLLSISMHPAVVLALLPAVMRSEDCKIVAFSELDSFPEIVVETLARDSSALVRAEVARYSRAPQLLEALSTDQDERVREALASNINVPPALLLALLYDPDPTVRETARESHSRGYIFDTILSDPKSATESIELVAERLYTTRDPEQSGIVCLVEPESWPARCQLLAQHPNTKTERLEELWHHGGTDAWMGLAKNPNTPEYILEVMAYSQDASLLDALLDNPAAPVSLIIKRIEQGQS
jgi:hypothetical protein